jgi:hypothetical protein
MAILGYRFWRVWFLKDDAVVTGVYYADHVWTGAQWNNARCAWTDQPSLFSASGRVCDGCEFGIHTRGHSWGFYAMKTVEDAVREFYRSSLCSVHAVPFRRFLGMSAEDIAAQTRLIFGIVALAGKVVEAEKGYRATRAFPVGVFGPGPQAVYVYRIEEMKWVEAWWPLYEDWPVIGPEFDFLELFAKAKEERSRRHEHWP